MRATITLALAAIILVAAAYLRPPEYDEAYSIFLTAGNARPAWPGGIFTPAEVRHFYTGRSSFSQIARDLRTGDVHPPLYFWLLQIWRQIFGPGWLTARLLAVALSVATLTILARLAALLKIPATSTILLTVLTYAYAYTSILIRDFALAQLLNVLGFYLILHVRGPARQAAQATPAAAGLAFGAATFTNYLAIFPALAAFTWLILKHPRAVIPATAAFALFLPPDAFFYLAQKSSRAGQFTRFTPGHAIAQLARDAGAALYGGLPVYAGRAAPAVTLALVALTATVVVFIFRTKTAYRGLFALAAIATPVGLLLLGLVFNNTPIEIRYLAFGIPYFALLAAGAAPLPFRALLIGLGSLAVIGLARAPATMQPQALAARQAAALATPTTLTLVPFGNDGVGVPGPFIAAAPDNLRIELIHPDQPPNFGAVSRLIVALPAADTASRAAIQQTLDFLKRSPCWRESGGRNLARVFNRIRPAA